MQKGKPNFDGQIPVGLGQREGGERRPEGTKGPDALFPRANWQLHS